MGAAALAPRASPWRGRRGAKVRRDSVLSEGAVCDTGTSINQKWTRMSPTEGWWAASTLHLKLFTAKHSDQISETEDFPHQAPCNNFCFDI